MLSSEDWTVVSSRRRRGRRARSPGHLGHNEDKHTLSHSETSNSTAEPAPWTPADAEEDQARVSGIRERLHSSLTRLESSAFYLRFVSQFREEIREKLFLIAPPPAKIKIVLYGVGSIEKYETPRLQFSLAILLKRELRDSIGEIEVFDPILSAAECAAMEAMGCAMPRFNDCGWRRADSPTLFYMPHCEITLYNNLFSANLGEFPSLGQIVVLGNSFKKYEELTDMTIRRIMREGFSKLRLQDARFSIEEITIAGLVSDDNEKTAMAGAFNDTSWHFFHRLRIEETENSALEVELSQVSAAASRLIIVD